jgi:hypothetical protein
MANGGRKAPGFSIKLIVLRDMLEISVGEVLGSSLRTELPRPPADTGPPFATEICNVWVNLVGSHGITARIVNPSVSIDVAHSDAGLLSPKAKLTVAWGKSAPPQETNPPQIVWPKAIITVAWGKRPAPPQGGNPRAIVWPTAIFTCARERIEYGLQPNNRVRTRVPGVLPQATVKMAFGQSWRPALRLPGCTSPKRVAGDRFLRP